MRPPITEAQDETPAISLPRGPERLQHVQAAEDEGQGQAPPSSRPPMLTLWYVVPYRHLCASRGRTTAMLHAHVQCALLLLPLLLLYHIHTLAAEHLRALANASSPSSRRQRQRGQCPSLRDGQFLGRGGSKSVVQRRKGTLVAVMTSQTQDLTREATLMTRLRLRPHPHLLPLLAIEYDASSRVSMVAPIARYGSMLDLVTTLEFDGLQMTHPCTAEAWARWRMRVVDTLH